MSEPNNSGFPFTEMTGDGLDIASIFGGASGGTTPSSVNPFEAALAQQAPPAAPVPPAHPNPCPRWHNSLRSRMSSPFHPPRPR